MCGLVGFCGNGDDADLKAMADAITHRGPDGAGYYSDMETRVFLGHRRLAILDIAGGYQPMWNEDDQVGIVFNGEIYNFQELRAELVLKGHIFRSDHSDTEVLIHGYEEWGASLLGRLNGMFAFVIYDKKNRRLFAARDRFGEKPFYYTHQKDFFGFASELTALRMHPKTPTEINRNTIQKLFAYGFIPAPNSMIRDVQKLPAGHFLTYCCETGQLKIEEYWRYRIEPSDDYARRPEADLCEELRELLSSAVKQRMVSDVPVGIFLSGGIDSSAILAFATRQAQAGQVNTFSIGFTDRSFDESVFARQAAKAFGSRHHEDILDLDKARGLIPTVLSNLDEPLGDSSILPTYLLAKFARQKVTVALGGDGGDELFAGYDPFHALEPSGLYRRLVPKPLHDIFASIAGHLPVSTRNMSFDFKVKRALRGLSHPPELMNAVWLGALSPDEMADLCASPLPTEELYSEALAIWRQSPSLSLIDKTLEFYARLYLQDDILTKVDRATMQVSLEARAPFLDNNVVNFARQLPSSLKYHRGVTKYILKKALEKVVPQEILRRKKKGFGVPMTRWLRQMSDFPCAKTNIFREPSEMHRRWTEHRKGAADHRLALWSWMALQYFPETIERGTSSGKSKI